MKVLIVGGARHVGTMTLPYMKSHHQFRVLDCREHGMSIIALQITGTSTRQQWIERRGQPKSDHVYIWATDEEDLARAYLAGLSVEHTGFDAVFIAGDEGTARD